MRRLLLSLWIGSAVLCAGTLLTPRSAMAQTGGNASACQQSVGGFLGFPTWYKYLNPRIDGGQCKVDFQFPDDIGKVLLAVVEILMRLAGIIAVAFVIWGGFQFMLSQGDPQGVKGGRSTVINALIGLVIAMSATAIVNLIGRNIT